MAVDIRDRVGVQSVIEKFKPSVVIVTAGVSNPDRIEDSWFEFEISTNLVGAFNVAQACIHHRVKTTIFIASVAGLFGKPNHSAYSASKAGIISLVQSMAMEGHSCFAISPGRVDTPMRQKDYPLDTPGSRLEPKRIWEVVQKIIEGQYESGSNVMIRKEGLSTVHEEVVLTPYRDILRVGQPLTI